MAGLWQRTGNVTVTNGSKTITGFGTKWKTGTLPIQKGHTFYGPDNAAYEVDTVVSDTEILLVDTYRGGTLANQPYRIDITRTSTISQFAADLASLVAKYRSWFDGMMTWLTGSGDVAILNPDTGANVTIPSWKKVTSEGEGQAARAKTEADKAAASAALAGDIVVASALPLPDVWAPLSDSLRMITGYGREVKVGDDVVARMVNFSRSTTRTYTAKDGTLKIAAINEPCFEKEGLHLDVQSTNLIPSFPLSGVNVTVQKTTLPQLAIPVYRITVPAGALGYLFVATAKEAAVYTASLWATVESGIPSAFYLQTNYKGSDGVFKAATVALSQSALERRSVTCTNAVAGASDNYLYINNSGGASPCVVLVAGWQLEALAWASSYIPTDGAAVTRAADFLQFIGPGNHPDVLPGVPFTFAMRMSCEESTSGSLRDVLVCPNIGYSLLRRAGSSIRYYRDGSGQLSISAPGKKMNVIAVKVTAENSCTLRVGASQATRTEVLNTGRKVTTVDITNVAGHVRDFRIWQHALTDEQFKAIA
ncbi:hypothetical protein ABR853_16325 [Aeromonas caviae]|uniref:phage head spike fiber domain-containing protein n=1 Tax=Aeromonas caviae TaxID=648 RepID=UPI0033062EF6